ncbi:UvrD-helicase domain-containing protein [Pseudomonas sp. P5_A2_2]
MLFRIADTFTSSLARLTGDEQKAVKTTAFDLQVDPASPGLSFHKLDKARDKNFWSVRVSRDIRIIVHRTAASLLLCYVDHHDEAYKWAERRRLETHPATGAAQLVELRETVADIVVRGTAVAAVPPPLTTTAARKPRLFDGLAEGELLGWGVPQEWLAAVRDADEDSLLELASHLPAEAAEALLELATGGKPQRAAPPPASGDPFDHPDAQRRFRTMEDADALARAMDAPWDRWTVFLHPAQRQWVEREQGGPARVSGSAGTGKTIVAVHRAAFLARQHADSRVLLTTFSPTLAHALHARLRRLIGNTPMLGERIDVVSLDELGERLYRFAFGKPSIALADWVRAALAVAAKEVQAGQATSPVAKLSEPFLWGEWADVVDAWQLSGWEQYRDFKRLGRKTRLSEAQRASAWSVFERVLQRLRQENRVTPSGMFSRLAVHYAGTAKSPFEQIVVDEAQDTGVQQLRFLAALGGNRPNGLFFAGDLGQRIFQAPFSWKSLGVDLRGRARTLQVNYRTSHQIRSTADRLLGPEVSDVDGNSEVRRGTISVFNGPVPSVKMHSNESEECQAVAQWLTQCAGSGIQPGEIGIFVRSADEVPRALAAAASAGLPHHELDALVDTDPNEVAIGTMHLAKGLEFRAVVVMACDEDILPLRSRLNAAADEADLREVFDTERHLLYVACTRARDRLLVTGVDPASEFLADIC